MSNANYFQSLREPSEYADGLTLQFNLTLLQYTQFLMPPKF